MSSSQTELKNVQLSGPFDSLREYVAALEAAGRLIRIEEMDQDQYESTGFAYRLIENLGAQDAPAFLIEKIKIDGKWRQGPVLGNLYGGWVREAMVFGVDNIENDSQKMYHAVIEKMFSRLNENGEWKTLKPSLRKEPQAPCKEVILTGDDIDILEFPWLKNHPFDGGRYINTTAVFVQDPELGRNVGTYRCHVKDKRKISVNATPGQHGGRMLRIMKARGQKTANVAIALGVDPMVWALSTSKLSDYGQDELDVAGGLKGSPIEVVPCETSDILVPAEAEMIIEGEIPLHEGEPEGPYGEMYGYVGPGKDDCFFMNIKAVTHRRDPMFFNSYTGLSPDMIMGPIMANHYWRLKRLIPNLTGVYQFNEASGMLTLSIKKQFAGEGLQAGQYAIAGPTIKVAIVVDDDIDIMNPLQVFHAIASRWQPSASIQTPPTRLTMPDPSLPHRGLSTKMVIDATQQFAQENGPPSWPPLNRDLLEEQCPDLMDLVDEKWSQHWRKR